MDIKKLKVTSIKYYSTRRGLSYECKTNVDGVQIWNDGQGGGTYLINDNDDEYRTLTENQLEKLIDRHEIVNDIGEKEWN